jgi:hypothetical protein
MKPVTAERERDPASALRAIRDDVRATAKAALAPPVAPPVSSSTAPSFATGSTRSLERPDERVTHEEPARPAEPAAVPPDLGALAVLAEATATRPGGGLLSNLSGGASRETHEAQVRFNQEQLATAARIIQYLHARLAATHAHYDRILEAHANRMNDIDARHIALQRDLIGHVHDLARRIDIAMDEAQSGRMSLDFLLRDLQARLEALTARVTKG